MKIVVYVLLSLAAAAATQATVPPLPLPSLNATKATAKALLDDARSGAGALASALEVALAAKRSDLFGKLDPGTPVTLVTSVNGSNTVTCGRDRQCYAPEFRAVAGGIAAAFSQLSTPWTDTNISIMVISRIPFVEGSVDASEISPAGSVFEVSSDASSRYLRGNGLPRTPMGSFPVKATSRAYSYYAALPAGIDPSTGQPYTPKDTADEIYIATYNLTSEVPLEPVATGFYPINALIVGVTLTGAVWHIEAAADSDNNWYNPSNALPMDGCFGHPFRNQYHHHAYSWKCFPERGPLGGVFPRSPLLGLHSPLYGYALDGFGIYGPLDVDGKMISNARLDECHGHVGPVAWDGAVAEMYHYHLNREYPYSVGCFRGKVNYYRALGSDDMRQTTEPIYYDGPYPL